MNTEDSNINYVYLLHAEGSDRFKIGHSNNPDGRCQKIRQQSPFPISLVCSYIVINAHECEQKLHKMFSHRRIHGEWFVFESRDHARGLIDEFFSVGLHARLQNKEVKKSRKVDLKLAQDVCSLIKKSELPVITLYECFLHPSLIAYNLTPRMVEDVFDYLQELEIGKKYIEDDNAQTITFYLRKTPMNYPEVVESVYSQILSIPEPNPIPKDKDWILIVLYHRTTNPNAKYPADGVIRSVLDFGLEFAFVEDWDISLEDYNTAKLNQQTRWLAWQEGPTPIISGMKKTTYNEQES